MNNLKDQLLNLGFQQTPQKKRKKERGEWKEEVKKRLLDAEDVFSELKSLIKETHDHFKSKAGSGKWFRKFLRPLYALRDILENDENECLSAEDKKRLIKKTLVIFQNYRHK